MPSYRGELRLPNKHAIAATHQGAADSNEALPRRGRGAVNAEAWRGDDGPRLLACSSPPPAWFRRRRHRRRRQRGLCVAEALLLRGLVLLASRARQLGPASCGGRVGDVAIGSALRCRESSPQSVLSDAHCRVRLLGRLTSFWAALPGGFVRADGVANRPNNKRPQLPVGILALGS